MRKRISNIVFHLVALVLAAASFAMLMTAHPGHAAPQIGQDKYMHAGVSIGLGLAARATIKDPVKAWALAMAPGIAKEAWDATRKGGTGWSWGDLLADGIGAYVGVSVGNLIFSRNSIRYHKEF